VGGGLHHPCDKPRKEETLGKLAVARAAPTQLEHDLAAAKAALQ
jgi:hypothetical protein